MVIIKKRRLKMRDISNFDYNVVKVTNNVSLSLSTTNIPINLCHLGQIFFSDMAIIYYGSAIANLPTARESIILLPSTICYPMQVADFGLTISHQPPYIQPFHAN